MSKNRRDNRIFLPAPIRGVDFRNSVFDTPARYSPMMFNFLPVNGKLVKRNAHNELTLNAALDGSPPLVITYTDGTTIVPIAVGKSNTVSATATSGSHPAGFQPTRESWCQFRDQLLVTHSILGTVYRLNPTTLAYTAGLTFTNGGKASICVHRERVYVGSGKFLYYGGVGAYTAAAMTAFDLTNIITGGISSIKSLSISVTGTLDHVLVIISTLGEVIIYAGGYPAALDWTLINRFNVDIDASTSPDYKRYVELIEVPGDLLIVPTGGFSIFSLKALISGNVESSDFFAPMRPLFDDVEGYRVSNVEFRGSKSAVYWPTRNSLVVVVSVTNNYWPFQQRWSSYFDISTLVGSTNYDTTTVVALYDFVQNIWTLHTLNDYDGCFNIIAAARDYVLIPGIQSAIRLFDTGAGVNWYLDNGTDVVKSLACLVPESDQFSNKRSTLGILYGLEQNDAAISVATQRSFDVSQASTFTSINYTQTTNYVTGAIVDLTGVDHSVQVQVLYQEPDAESPLKWEFYGIDVLYEPGGEING